MLYLDNTFYLDKSPVEKIATQANLVSLEAQFYVVTLKYLKIYNDIIFNLAICSLRRVLHC